MTIASAITAEAQVAVSVTDTGEGVPEGFRDRLFTAFFTTRPQGLGLGLSICRSVIEAPGGRLWYEPAPDHGSAFRFSLPIAAEP